MSSPNKGTSPLEEEEEKIEDGPASDSLNTVDEAVPSSPSSSTGKRVTWPNIAKKTPSPQRRLSAVSKMYDIDGVLSRLAPPRLEVSRLVRARLD